MNSPKKIGIIFKFLGLVESESMINYPWWYLRYWWMLDLKQLDVLRIHLTWAMSIIKSKKWRFPENGSLLYFCGLMIRKLWVYHGISSRMVVYQSQHKGYGDLEVSIKWGYPPNGWFLRETPIKMDDLEVPLFMETSIYRWVMWEVQCFFHYRFYPKWCFDNLSCA